MSAPIDLNLDFQDYIPSVDRRAAQPDRQQSPQSGTIVRIPDGNRPTKKIQNISGDQESGTSGILNILQSISSTSGISDESLRQLSWASGEQPTKSPSAANIGWGLKYLAKYFDVTTNEVLQRIIWSVVPVNTRPVETEFFGDGELMAPLATPSDSPDESSQGKAPKTLSYMDRFIQGRPDLYGPFWISVTLMFTVAIFSNFVSLTNYKLNYDGIDTQNQSVNSNGSEKGVKSDHNLDEMEDWYYSFDELNTISSVVTMYLVLWPTILYTLFWFRGCEKYYTLMETICVFGYSLSVYVPLSAFLMIQFMPFRYFISAIASLSSGLVLILSFLPVAKSDPSPASSHIILAIIMIFHVGLSYIIHRIMLE